MIVKMEELIKFINNYFFLYENRKKLGVSDKQLLNLVMTELYEICEKKDPASQEK